MTDLQTTTVELPATVDEATTALMGQYSLVMTKAQRMIVEANMGQAEVSYRTLKNIRIPRDGLFFTIDEGAAPVRVFNAVILGIQRDRRFYKAAYNPDVTSPPDCSSEDMITGVPGEESGEPGGPCATCPHNVYGTGVAADGTPSKGKACAEYSHLLIKRQGSGAIPEVFAVPPSSLKSVSSYMQGLGLAPYYATVTEFSLIEDRPVSKLKLAMARNKDGEPMYFPVETWDYLWAAHEEAQRLLKPTS